MDFLFLEGCLPLGVEVIASLKGESNKLVSGDVEAWHTSICEVTMERFAPICEVTFVLQEIFYIKCKDKKFYKMAKHITRSATPRLVNFGPVGSTRRHVL